MIRDHIETNHLEGICLPCDLCNKTFSARGNLKKHKYSLHAKQGPTDLAKEQEHTNQENKDELKKATKHQINQELKADVQNTATKLAAIPSETSVGLQESSQVHDGERPQDGSSWQVSKWNAEAESIIHLQSVRQGRPRQQHQEPHQGQPHGGIICPLQYM